MTRTGFVFLFFVDSEQKLFIITWMTWIDIVLVIILIVLVLHGIMIGLIRGIFDIAGIILGYLLAINFSGALKIPNFLAFLLIFIVVVVAISILGRVISKVIHITLLGSIDRLLGGLLGFLKGFIICFVFLIVLLLLQRSNRVLLKSAIAPWVVRGGLKASQILPKIWYERIKEITTERELVRCQMSNYNPN